MESTISRSRPRFALAAAVALAAAAAPARADDATTTVRAGGAAARANTISIDPVLGVLGFTGRNVAQWALRYERRLGPRHAVLVEQAGRGAEVAAPIAGDLMDLYLNGAK